MAAQSECAVIGGRSETANAAHKTSKGLAAHVGLTRSADDGDGTRSDTEIIALRHV